MIYYNKHNIINLRKKQPEKPHAAIMGKGAISIPKVCLRIKELFNKIRRKEIKSTVRNKGGWSSQT